jgi:DtxR family Mn-dependent transcriptional regulator
VNTSSEQNYLKAIFHLEQEGGYAITTDIAQVTDHKAASVTEMLKKMSEKKLIRYEKYHGVRLTPKGKRSAVNIVRKHRLWEVFLLQELGFLWDEVHDMAEQLEHIESDELVGRLDKYLGHPKFDPHGDPIPDKNGKIVNHRSLALSDARPKEKYILAGVSNHDKNFLKHLSELGIKLNDEISIKSVMDYDRSMTVNVNGRLMVLTQKIANGLKVVKG